MLLPTAMVTVELPMPGAAIDLGLKDTVVPEGTPDAASATELLKPATTAVVITVVPWLPCATPREDGDAVIVKLPMEVTVSVNVVDC